MAEHVTNSGFSEIPHTADLAVVVWADCFKALLQESIQAMFALMGAHAADMPSTMRHLAINLAVQREDVLVDVLAEVLYLCEDEKLVCTAVDFTQQANQLLIDLHVTPYEQITRLIKAVTYHGLNIVEENGLLKVTIVFDV